MNPTVIQNSIVISQERRAGGGGAGRGRYHRGNYCCQGRVRFNYLQVYMNVSVNDTLTLTRLGNRGAQLYPERCRVMSRARQAPD